MITEITEFLEQTEIDWAKTIVLKQLNKKQQQRLNQTALKLWFEGQANLWIPSHYDIAAEHMAYKLKTK